MANVVVIKLTFSARMAIVFVEELPFGARITTSVIFKVLLVTLMAGIFVEVWLVFRAEMAFIVIKIVSAGWAYVALSLVEEWCIFRAF